MDRRWPCMSSWSHPSRYYSSNKLRQTIARTIATHPTWKSRHLFTLHQCYPATSQLGHTYSAHQAVPARQHPAQQAPSKALQSVQRTSCSIQTIEATKILLPTGFCNAHTASIQLHLRSPFYTHIILPTAIPHQGPQGEKKARSGVSQTTIFTQTALSR